MALEKGTRSQPGRRLLADFAKGVEVAQLLLIFNAFAKQFSHNRLAI
jgi:hypothetical protein